MVRCWSTGQVNHGERRMALVVALSMVALVLLMVDSVRFVSAMRYMGLRRPVQEFSERLYERMMDFEVRHHNIGNYWSNQSFLISPLSIHAGLCMIMLGATGANEDNLLKNLGYGMDPSAEERDALHYNYQKFLSEMDHDHGNEGHGPDIQTLIMLILKDINMIKDKKFATDAERYYRAELRDVKDRESVSKLRDYIDNWFKKAGYEDPGLGWDYDKSFFEPELLTALRVTASWLNPFHEVKGHFYNWGLKDSPKMTTYIKSSNMRKARCLMFTDKPSAMHKHLHGALAQDAIYKKLSEFDFHLVEIPLHGKLDLIIVEPLEYSTRHYNKLIETTRHLLRMSGKKGPDAISGLEQAIELLDSDKIRGQNEIESLEMPKFIVHAKNFGLKESLRDMFIPSIELHNIDLVLKHRTIIDVNKAGIGNALPVEGFATESKPLKSSGIHVKITKPFLFILRFKHVPLLMGQVLTRGRWIADE